MLYSCKTAGFRYLAFQSYFRVVFERDAVIAQPPQSSMSLNNMLFRGLYIELCIRIHTSSLCCMVLLGTSPTSFFGEVLFFFSGLTAGPTYRPPVRHSNPDAPLKRSSKKKPEGEETKIGLTSTAKKPQTPKQSNSVSLGIVH